MIRTVVLGFLISGLFSVANAQQLDSARMYYQKGLSETAAGRHKPAFEYYKKASSYDTSFIDAYRGMGLAATEMRQFEIAKQSFRKVLQKDPTDQIAIEQFGTLSFMTRRWDDAILYGQKMLDLGLGSKVNYMIGKSYFEKENFGLAFRYLDAAYKEDSTNAEIPFLFARSFVEMNNYKMAVKYYREAIALDTTKTQWVYELAMAYSSIPDDKAAIPYYELAMARGYKVDNDFIENLSSAYVSSGQPEKGIAMLSKLLEMRPADLELLYFVADTYYKMGKYDDAIAHWDKVLAYDKENARSLYMIGMSLQKKGDTKRGQALCDKAIEMDPSLKAMRREKQGMGL
jgi:tetratricopeptide (TPR) repeat protein